MFFSLTVSLIDNQFYRSWVNVVDVIDLLLEQDTWLLDLVFPETQ